MDRRGSPAGGIGSDELVALCLEQADEAIWVLDAASGELAYANPRALDWFGPGRFPRRPGIAVLSDGRRVAAVLTPVRGGRLVGRAGGSEGGGQEGETLIPALSLALERGEFMLRYQPRFDCASGRLLSLEALLRWNHPALGILLPADFLAALEETGLIIPVGLWVLDEACRQLRAWHAAEPGGERDPSAGAGRLCIAINLSSRQLDDPGFPESVAAAVRKHGLPPDCLEFELPERVLTKRGETLHGELERIRAIGVRLRIDDFGTAYSCLSSLKRLPLDAVILDHSFVRNIVPDANEASIARAVIGMAHMLKLRVVADGVESDAQLSLLLDNECDEVQGFLFGEPVPAEEAGRKLAEGWALEPAQVARTARQRTLLLVDDEENILNALKRLLRRDGYRILTARSGAEGLQVLATEEVDVIVSDQRMPGMTGVEFLRKAKERFPETVRMVLSGYTELQSVTDAINEGAIYKFLTKPWDDAMLKANVEEAFGRKALSDENRLLTHQVHVANIELTRVNAHLQEVLEAQNRRLAIDESLIQVTQAAIQALPLPVLGVDREGLVVLANTAATRDLPGVALVGAQLDEILPPAVAGLAAGGKGRAHVVLEGKSWGVFCAPMGAVETAPGLLYTFVPSQC